MKCKQMTQRNKSSFQTHSFKLNAVELKNLETLYNYQVK